MKALWGGGCLSCLLLGPYWKDWHVVSSRYCWNKCKNECMYEWVVQLYLSKMSSIRWITKEDKTRRKCMNVTTTIIKIQNIFLPHTPKKEKKNFHMPLYSQFSLSICPWLSPAIDLLSLSIRFLFLRRCL